MNVPKRPLSALLSQVLVAFTVEFDNEFERRMGEAGYLGARLSLVVWTNLMRFVGEGAVSVRELAAQALAPGKQMKFRVGVFGAVGIRRASAGSGGRSTVPSGEHRQSGRIQRDGWGSGRGIRADWMVRLTSKGLTASRIWPPLFGEIEQRWEKRFGEDEIGRLRQALQGVADKLDVELPHGLPGGWLGTPRSFRRGSDAQRTSFLCQRCFPSCC